MFRILGLNWVDTERYFNELNCQSIKNTHDCPKSVLFNEDFECPFEDINEVI